MYEIPNPSTPTPTVAVSRARHRAPYDIALDAARTRRSGPPAPRHARRGQFRCDLYPQWVTPGPAIRGLEQFASEDDARAALAARFDHVTDVAAAMTYRVTDQLGRTWLAVITPAVSVGVAA